MDKKGTLEVGKEILAEHKKLAGAEMDEYIKMNFDTLWDHFDVNHVGLVEIERMSQFYKMLLNDMTADI